MTKLTELQREGLKYLQSGHPNAFGAGFDSHRVALLALHHKAPDLVRYQRDADGREWFTITEAGRAAIR